MHETANGVTTTQATDYASAEALKPIKRDAILRDSERFVKRYAPPPADGATAEELEAYRSAAADSEMRLFDYLTNTEGMYSSIGISGISESYVDLEKVEKLVVSLMADYGLGYAADDVAYVGRPPQPC